MVHIPENQKVNYPGNVQTLSESKSIHTQAPRSRLDRPTIWLALSSFTAPRLHPFVQILSLALGKRCIRTGSFDAVHSSFSFSTQPPVLLSQNLFPFQQLAYQATNVAVVQGGVAYVRNDATTHETFGPTHSLFLLTWSFTSHMLDPCFNPSSSTSPRCESQRTYAMIKVAEREIPH